MLEVGSKLCIYVGALFMEKFSVDVPVYINFFNRPETLKFVFETVKKARPSQLFLSCDGPRNERDLSKIKECIEIVENIDWECEVHKNYSDVNLGCGKRMFTGISWAFEHVDRLIILEDDCVPSISFFQFAKEMLKKYEHDERFSLINAMNHLGKYRENESSYFFGPSCCWGWATWKRAWMHMDFDMNFMDDIYSMKCVERKYVYYGEAIKTGIERKEILKKTGRLSAWTYQFGMSQALQSTMAIVPSVNMITNIGLTCDSTHAVNNLKKLDRKTRQYFNMERYEMTFPLKDPKYVIEDLIYYDLIQKKFRTNIFDRIDGILRRHIFYRNK